MSSLRTLVRRTVTVGVAAVAATAVALVFATPASAHHSSISGQATCATDGDGWIVTWTIRSWDSQGKPPKWALMSVKTYTAGQEGGGPYTGDLAGPYSSTTFGLPAGALVKSYQDAFVGQQAFSAADAQAVLKVEAIWSNGRTATNTSAPVTRPECSPPDPEPQPVPSTTEPAAPAGPPPNSTPATVTSTDPPLAATGADVAGLISVGAGLVALGGASLATLVSLRRRRDDFAGRGI